MTLLDHACALRPKLVGLALLLTHDLWLAEDVTHDVLLRVILRPELLPARPAEHLPYLAQAVRRRVIDHGRRGQRIRWESLPDRWLSGAETRGVATLDVPDALIDYSDPGHILLRREEWQAVRVTLARLTPRSRQALLDCYVRDIRPCDQAGLKSASFHARAAFRREWEQVA